MTVKAILRDPAPAGGVTATFFAFGVGESPATGELDFTLDPPHPSGAANVTADIVIPEGSYGARAALRVVNDAEGEGDERIEVGIVTTPSMYAFPVDTLTIPANDGGLPAGRLAAEPNPVADGGTANAALAVVGSLSPEDAAGALFGERSLGGERLAALDRLGNANGRYDVGDLLAWIERCRARGARCGPAPRTPPPALDEALPGTAGAAARRPRRRPPGGRRPKRCAPRGRRSKRRRLCGLAVLLVAALWSCDGAGVVDAPSAANTPEPGYLAVEWTAPAGGPPVAGALVEIDGPHVGGARATGGLELYATERGSGPRRFVIAGDLRDGPALEVWVPDRRDAHLYEARVVEVAGEDHRLLNADGYRMGIASN